MDLNRLTLGDRIIGVSGIALFIFSFFKWLGIKASSTTVNGREIGGSDSKGAWSFPLLLIAVLIGIALVVYVALKASDVKLPNLGSVTWAQVVLGLAALAFLFVLIKLIAGPSGWNGFDIPDGVDKTRKVAIYLGLIATAGLVAGAFLNFQAERGGVTRPGGTPPTV